MSHGTLVEDPRVPCNNNSHSTHRVTMVDLQFCFLQPQLLTSNFCFLFFQFSHWLPGVGFTFFFLLLGSRGREKLDPFGICV